MYTFTDNFNGDKYSFATLREAKKEANKHTYGFPVYITKGMDIVAVIAPKDNPLP